MGHTVATRTDVLADTRPVRERDGASAVVARHWIARHGIGRLVEGPLLARVSAATVLCVNPWVFSRVYAGQLLVLMDLALLPFAVAAALRDRGGHEAGGAIVCALCSLTLLARSRRARHRNGSGAAAYMSAGGSRRA